MRPSRPFRDFLLLGALAVPLAAPVAAQAPLPDLIVSSLTLAPASVAPGGGIDISSEIRNVGAGTAPLPATVPPSTSAWVDYFLVTSITDTHGDRLTGWGPLVAMPPGSAQHYTSHATIPAGKAPGAYFVCADIDPTHLVAESNETNNRLCRPLTVTGGKRRRASGPDDHRRLGRRRHGREPRRETHGERTAGPGLPRTSGWTRTSSLRGAGSCSSRPARRRRAAAPRPARASGNPARSPPARRKRTRGG